ncbi:hypothetical protein [Brevibacterium sp.]|uniref:hypothetical protein n=1 Tax=Brevibacterium sp. TaxID=1701 RepID=UPI0025C12DA7|nr:hypothetical protein [Brevibacterium sp.]
MTGVFLLTQVALRRDRGRLFAWSVGMLAFATVCAMHVTSGFGEEAVRAASLRAAIDSPALLVGRGLPMGASHGAFLFYTHGVLLANVFALFAVFFTIRHGHAEEDDGSRELMRAAATGKTASLAAALAAGTAGLLLLALAMIAGLLIGGAQPGGAFRAGLVCALVGAVFLPLGALSGQIAPTSRAAAGLSFAVVIGFFAVRVAADLLADVDPATLVGSPVPLAWFSPFSLAGIADPFGSLDLRALLVLVAATVLGLAAAFVCERRREFGESALRARPGPPHAPASLRTPLQVQLRLQRGTLVAMALAGAVVGAFAAVMAGMALGSEQDQSLDAAIRDVVGGDGSLYDLLLGYVMVLVGECAAVAGALTVLHARREERAGNGELVRAAASGPGRWLASVLGAGLVSVLTVLAAAALGAMLVHLLRGADAGLVLGLSAAAAAQAPAALLHLGLIGLVFAVRPRLTAGVAWSVLVLGVVIAELGGRLGLPEWILVLSPFLHSPLVTMPDTQWAGAIWMTAVSLVLAFLAVAAYRRRDLTP